MANEGGKNLWEGNQLDFISGKRAGGQKGKQYFGKNQRGSACAAILQNSILWLREKNKGRKGWKDVAKGGQAPSGSQWESDMEVKLDKKNNTLEKVIQKKKCEWVR